MRIPGRSQPALDEAIQSRAAALPSSCRFARNIKGLFTPGRLYVVRLHSAPHALDAKVDNVARLLTFGLVSLLSHLKYHVPLPTLGNMLGSFSSTRGDSSEGAWPVAITARARWIGGRAAGVGASVPGAR